MKIKEYLNQFNIDYKEIISKYPDEFNITFQNEHDENWLIPVEDKLNLIQNDSDRQEIQNVINTLKSNKNFDEKDIQSISIFISKINSIIKVADRINNFKQGTKLDDNELLSLSTLFNSLKNANYLSDLRVSRKLCHKINYII